MRCPHGACAADFVECRNDLRDAVRALNELRDRFVPNNPVLPYLAEADRVLKKLAAVLDASTIEGVIHE